MRHQGCSQNRCRVESGSETECIPAAPYGETASSSEDVATTRRVIDAQPGSVVLVGHSYGGAVITSAAVGAPNVRALVYVAAFAPESGELLQALLEKYPSKIGSALVPDAVGFLYIDRAKFKEVFAADVADRERSVMAATQKPIKGEIFGHVFEK